MERRVPELHYKSSRICRVLGNPTAYQILRLLAEGRRKPSDIAAKLRLSLPTISSALRSLRQLDLVRYENQRQGKFYFLKDTTILEVMNNLETLVRQLHTREY